ncbi:MAG: hypothetical protein WCJ71_02985 [Candidatus Omnitrophota bacterium]
MVADRSRLSTTAVHPLLRRMPACALADGTCSNEQGRAPINSESCLDATPVSRAKSSARAKIASQGRSER